MLNFIVLSDIMLSVSILSVIMLSVAFSTLAKILQASLMFVSKTEKSERTATSNVRIASVRTC
jgi:hypothetical protein